MTVVNVVLKQRTYHNPWKGREKQQHNKHEDVLFLDVD